jgi:hypothetical protein
LLFVPDGDVETFYALSGVTIATEGDLKVVDEELSKINFNISKNTESLSTVVKLDKFTS